MARLKVTSTSETAKKGELTVKQTKHVRRGNNYKKAFILALFSDFALLLYIYLTTR